MTWADNKQQGQPRTFAAAKPAPAPAQPAAPVQSPAAPAPTPAPAQEKTADQDAGVAQVDKPEFWAWLEVVPQSDGGAIRKEYQKDGKLRLEDVYDADGNGTRTEYYETGELLARVPLKNRRPDGLAKAYYPSGKLRAETQFKEGVPVFLDREYYATNDDFKFEWEYMRYAHFLVLPLPDYKKGYHEKTGETAWDFFPGKKEGESVRRYVNCGKVLAERPYKDGKPHGMETEYHGIKARSETPYKDGNIDGIKKSYYENGRLASEFPYKDGKLHGVSKEYYENGKLKRESPSGGGVSKEYYPSGAVKEEMIFTAEPDQPYVVKDYYENGVLKRERSLVKGEPHGVEKQYSRKGDLVSETDWENGKQVGPVRQYGNQPKKKK